MATLAYEISDIIGAGGLDRNLPVDDGQGRLFWSYTEEEIVEAIIAMTECARSISETIKHTDDLVGKPLSDPPHVIWKVGAILLKKQRPSDGIKGKSALVQVAFSKWYPINRLEFRTVPPFGVERRDLPNGRKRVLRRTPLQLISEPAITEIFQQQEKIVGQQIV